MKKQAMKELIYGGLSELSNNDRFYRHSSLGPQYSYFTEDGKEALHEYMSDLMYRIRQIHEEELKVKAKEMVFAEIKKT